MKQKFSCLLGALFLPMMISGSACASSLQAMPVLVEMPVSAPTSAVTIRNSGNSAFDVQTRVFRWKQVDGAEVLEESDAVVTSPPIVTLKPGVNYSVRIVKVDGTPVEQEEAYRLFVDQLPDEDKLRSGTVAMVARHSIPVFMLPEQAGGPNLHWSLRSERGQVFLEAKNTGGRRVRLSGMSVTLPSGQKVSFGPGLLGYVLAGSKMRWRMNTHAGGLSSGQTARVSGASDLGPVNAPVKIER